MLKTDYRFRAAKITQGGFMPQYNLALEDTAGLTYSNSEQMLLSQWWHAALAGVLLQEFSVEQLYDLVQKQGKALE